jgi:hypothetical protein
VKQTTGEQKMNANQRIKNLSKKDQKKLLEIKKREQELTKKSWFGKLSKEEKREQKILDLKRIALIYETTIEDAARLRDDFNNQHVFICE